MNATRHPRNKQRMLRVSLGVTLGIVLGLALVRLPVSTTSVTAWIGVGLLLLFGGWFLFEGITTRAPTRLLAGIAALALAGWGAFAPAPRPWLLLGAEAVLILFVMLHWRRRPLTAEVTTSI